MYESKLNFRKRNKRDGKSHVYSQINLVTIFTTYVEDHGVDKMLVYILVVFVFILTYIGSIQHSVYI